MLLAKLITQSYSPNVLGALAQDMESGKSPNQLSQSHYHVEGSYGEICSNVYAAFRDYCRDQYTNDNYEWASWRNQILSILSDHVVFYRWRDEVCDYFKLTYTVDGAGKVTFNSEPEAVDVAIVVRALKGQDDEGTTQTKETKMNENETQKQDAVTDDAVVETKKAVSHSDAATPVSPAAETDANGSGASVPAPNDAAVADTGVEKSGDEGVSKAAPTGSTGAVAAELATTEAGLKGENPADPGKNVNVNQDTTVSLVGNPEFLLQHVGVDRAKGSFCTILEQSVVQQGSTKTLHIQGICTRAEIESAAGIVYPLEVWEQNMDPMNEAAQAGKFIGKLEHPDHEQGLIDTAIRFDKFWMQGNDVHFSGVVLNTENGKELQALIEGGVQIDMSSRGYGKALKQSWRGKEVLVIQSGFVCTGFDAVHYGASTGSAITEAVRQSKQTSGGPTEVEENANTQTQAATTQTTDKPQTQSKADALRDKALLQSTRASMLADSGLNATGQKAYEQALSQCATLEELVEKSDSILPTLAQTFAKPTADEAQEQGGTTYSPTFFTKQSKEELAPKTPGELIERLVADLPDTPYGSTVQGAFPDNHFRSPRAACRKMLQNIAYTRIQGFDGNRAIMGLLALEQGRVEQAGDILTQSLATGSTVAAGNADGDGAPLSAPLIFPLVRRVFPRYIMNEIASVQPMDRPEGKIFFLDQYRTEDPAGFEKRIDLNTSSNPFNSSYADNATEGAAAKLIRLRLTSESVSAHTKKLGAQWSIEEMQDLRAYHGLDAAQELMNGVAREMALEWNLEVLNDMLAQASAGSLTFGTAAPASGFPNQIDWDAYIWNYIQKLDNLIFSKRNGPMTHLVVGVDAALALAKSGRMTFTIGGENGGDMDEIYPGAVYMGVVNAPNGSRYKVLKTNFWGTGTTNGAKILGLRRGSEWSDTPYIWAPYTDYVTPMLTDPGDFSQKQGIVSRAAKKVVVGDAMGIITVNSSTGVVL